MLKKVEGEDAELADGVVCRTGAMFPSPPRLIRRCCDSGMGPEERFGTVLPEHLVFPVLGNSESTLRLHYDGRTDIGKRNAITALEI